jgi:hypothetical protein
MRIGYVAQEAPEGEGTPFATVLAAATERARLLAEAQHVKDPHRISEIHERLNAIDAHGATRRSAPGLRGQTPSNATSTSISIMPGNQPVPGEFWSPGGDGQTREGQTMREHRGHIKVAVATANGFAMPLRTSASASCPDKERHSPRHKEVQSPVAKSLPDMNPTSRHEPKV